MMRRIHPDAWRAIASGAGDAALGEGGQAPCFDAANKCADITAAPVEIKHDIDDALAGGVVSPLAAATGGADDRLALVLKALILKALILKALILIGLVGLVSIRLVRMGEQ